MPVSPASVTATCCHEPVVSAEGPLICFSPAPLPVVIANRIVPDALLARGARNMLVVVLLPESRRRGHVVVVVGLAQKAKVKSLRLLTTPVGSVPYWLLVAVRLTALLV